MHDPINARIPPRTERKLAAYCARRGVTRTEAVVAALDEYLKREADRTDGYSLAVDLIPARGAGTLQSTDVRRLARKAFRLTRTR